MLRKLIRTVFFLVVLSGQAYHPTLRLEPNPLVPMMSVLDPPTAGYDGTNLYTGEGAAVTVTRASDQRCKVQRSAFWGVDASGSHASTADTVQNSITGDIDIRVYAASSDWSPSTNWSLISKENYAPQRSWNFFVTTSAPTGRLVFYHSADGTAMEIRTSLATSLMDNAAYWVRVTRQASNGEVKFYTSLDGSSWTQIGPAQYGTPGPMYDGTAPINVGARGNGTAERFMGRIFYAEVRNGIDGQVAVVFDPRRTSSTGQVAFTGPFGETWNVYGPGWIQHWQLERRDSNTPCVEASGLKVEANGTNLLNTPEHFDSSSWPKSNLTITDNAIMAPDGRLAAQKLEATASAATLLNQSQVVSATTATCSVYAKKGSGATNANKFAMRNNTTATNLVIISLNYDTLAISYSVGASGAAVEHEAGGWLRVTISATSGIASGNTIVCYNFFVGDAATAGEYAYGWGAMLEGYPIPTSYASKNEPNALLMSEQLDNALWSDSGTVTVTANQGPLGYEDMDKVQSADNVSFRWRSGGLTGVSPFTLSGLIASVSGSTTQSLLMNLISGTGPSGACTCGRSDGGSCTVGANGTIGYAYYTSVTTTPIWAWLSCTPQTAVTQVNGAVHDGQYGTTGNIGGLFGRMMLEYGSAPENYAATGATVGTRASQTTTTPTPASLSRTEGCAYACVTPWWTGGSPTTVRFLDLTVPAGTAALLLYGNSGSTSIYTYDGTNIASVSAGYEFGSKKCYLTQWSASGNFLRITRIDNGVTSQAAFTTFPVFHTDVWIGVNAATSAWANANLSDIRFGSHPDACF